jgi:SAM-dependent methyltransferase
MLPGSRKSLSCDHVLVGFAGRNVIAGVVRDMVIAVDGSSYTLIGVLTLDRYLCQGRRSLSGRKIQSPACHKLLGILQPRPATLQPVKGYGFPFRMREWRWKIAGHIRRPLPPVFSEPLQGAVALEIGGPSPAFDSGGRLPIYGSVERLDACNFAAETLWARSADGALRPDDGKPCGRLWILEATDLHALEDDSYDVLLAAHVLEHVANPLRALDEWMRVVRPAGHVVLEIPHKEGTFDHRRPVTPLKHMLEDYSLGTTEDDLTHLDEVLRLHDIGRDPGVNDRREFERRSRANARNRGLHHHVFTTETAVQLLDVAGFQIRAVEPRWRQNIFLLARVPAPGASVPGNDEHLGPDAAWRRTSPFRADRTSRFSQSWYRSRPRRRASHAGRARHIR